MIPETAGQQGADPSMSDFGAAAAAACRRLLEAPRASAEPQPAHPYRRRQQCSVRVDLGDRTVIATRRRRSASGQLEAKVLGAMASDGATAPRVLAFDGTWMIQEDVGSRRLSALVHGASEAQCESYLDAALTSIVRCQEAGKDAGLERMVTISHGPQRLLAAPESVGTALGLAPPFVADWQLYFDLQRPWSRFIKWDTRLGNAIQRDDGSVVWVDWEECGRGEGLRDLVKVLLDEWIPNWPGAEERLIEKHLDSFLEDADVLQARDFVAVYGTLLAITRLGQILRLKGKGPWWEPATCLAHELVAVTPKAALGLCRRGARWAARSPVTDGFVPWLEALGARLPR